jgi:excinuclease ABC subunit A
LTQKEKVIELKGVRMHNLKGIDVNFKRNKFTVVTGVSGSGKSSLVFDTLYAEGQRRYVESLSSYARQFLGRLNKPEVDYIKGLTPCVAIEQKVNSRNPRSTVATSTEIYDYLKLLFTRVGKTFSPISGQEVKCHTIEDVVNHIIAESETNDQINLLVNLPLEDTQSLSELLDLEMKKGYSRLLYKGKIIKIDGFTETKVRSKDISLIVDRIIRSEDADDEFMTRVADSVQTAFYEGKGLVTVQMSDDERVKSEVEFSNLFELDGMTFERPTINFLSFNNPFGACSNCQGFGSVIGIDEDLVVPDQSLSLYEGAIAPWRGEVLGVWKKNFISACSNKYPIHKAYNELTDDEKDVLWKGKGELKGVNSFFDFLQENTYKIQYRVMMAKYRGKTNCPDCRGTRLRKDTDYVKLCSTSPLPVHSKNDPYKISISELIRCSISEATEVFQALKLNKADSIIANRLITEVDSRLRFLSDVGLAYLGLNRLSNSLSGGESQRINLATTLGSSLVGSTYILDEPSIGLHSKDTELLIGVLQKLKKVGNTVVVVEHDEEIMHAADELLDIGPHAGSLGGEVVFQGNFEHLAHADTLTANYLNNVLSIVIPEHRRAWNNHIVINNARNNNLKNITTKIPLNAFTVVSGVSGSGKTSLIKGVFYPNMLRELDQYTGLKLGESEGLSGDISSINAIEMVDQNPIGKSSRSNPVTYVKAYDAIRDLFSDQVISKQRGYKSSVFSFNIDGGRCDNCKGEGEEIIEMQFMADIHLPCESCKGQRFKDEILEVTFKEKRIIDVLNMTVDDAIEFFKDIPPIKKRLMPLQEVGLGYVTLGQSSNTLSGGEAQRIKLASFLSKSSSSTHTLFIFDEPTTGLHFHDIKKLLKSFNALIKKGNTIVCIEHNLDVIKSADWVIDLGPEGGKNGGYLSFAGTPEELAKEKGNVTGQYLAKKMSGELLNPFIRSN